MIQLLTAPVLDLGDVGLLPRVHGASAVCSCPSSGLRILSDGTLCMAWWNVRGGIRWAVTPPRFDAGLGLGTPGLSTPDRHVPQVSDREDADRGRDRHYGIRLWLGMGDHCPLVSIG